MVSLVSAAHAHSQPYLATAAQPVSIPLYVSPEARPSAGQFQYVDITVSGFRPAPGGPVQIVVEASGSGANVEIGRFGLYPERPFSTAEPAKVQRFALTIPKGVSLDESSRLTVRVAPIRGAVQGASIEVEPGQLR